MKTHSKKVNSLQYWNNPIHLYTCLALYCTTVLLCPFSQFHFRIFFLKLVTYFGMIGRWYNIIATTSRTELVLYSLQPCLIISITMNRFFFFSVRQLVLCKHLRYGPIVRLPASCFPKPFLNYPISEQILSSTKSTTKYLLETFFF